jgi:hypothetical protein
LKHFILVTFFLLSSCATTQVKQTFPTYIPDPLPEKIESRKDTVLPNKTGSPIALEKCTKCEVPFTGILLDSYLLSKYKLISTERDTLRVQIQAERQARAEVQQYYNLALQDALEKAKKSWFEDNKGLLGIVTGVVVTSALAIGLSFGLNASK